jgi:ribosomal protein S18 acetylase RimI-like enzyme
MGEVQRQIRWSILVLLVWVAVLLAMLIPGIILNIPGLIGGACLGLAYPIGSSVYGIYRLSQIRTISLSQGPTNVTASSNDVRLESLTERYFRGALGVENTFIGAGRKRLCCLLPLTLFPASLADFYIRYATENARSASVVAVRERDDKVVGYAHMTERGMERDASSQFMHSLKDGECYIESMSVLPEMRGQGIGTRLLEFCEARARERGARNLTLGVVANNPARHLYERFGFVEKKRGALTSCGSSLGLFCLLGCPHWRIGGDVMVKNLSEP